MSKRALTLLLLCAILALPTLAQGRKNVRINEVMVQQDSTGGNGWVEFYNSSYSSTAVEQMFITTLSREEIQNVFDKNKGNKEKSGDMRTPESPAGEPFTITMIQDASTWVHDFGDGRGSILLIIIKQRISK
jgi:hypothetical protein